MTTPQPTPPPPLSQPEGVAGAAPLPAGLRCIECGYLLDGQSASTRCPECGTPCLHSMESALYQRVSRESAQWLCVASGLIIGGVALCLLLPIVSVIPKLLIYASGGTISLAGFPDALHKPLFLIGSILIAAGQAWMVVNPFRDPAQDPGGRFVLVALVTILLRENLLPIANSLRSRGSILNSNLYPDDVILIGLCVTAAASHYLFLTIWQKRLALVGKSDAVVDFDHWPHSLLLIFLLYINMNFYTLWLALLAIFAYRLLRIFRRRASID